jgi:hypothetical protein
MLIWIILVLAHWNSLRVDMSFYWYTLSWFQADMSLLFLLSVATNTNFIVFGLTQLGLEPTIYHTQDKHANHYTTHAVQTQSL